MCCVLIRRMGIYIYIPFQRETFNTKELADDFFWQHWKCSAHEPNIPILYQEYQNRLLVCGKDEKTCQLLVDLYIDLLHFSAAFSRCCFSCFAVLLSNLYLLPGTAVLRPSTPQHHRPRVWRREERGEEPSWIDDFYILHHHLSHLHLHGTIFERTYHVQRTVIC